MKIWEKTNTKTDDSVIHFTTGKDREFDLRLAPYDVQGSLAHIEMLLSVGLLEQREYELLRDQLRAILEDIKSGKFEIVTDAEDIHSQIEQMLTLRVGSAGKKIHAGRSRNDQVALGIKLYLRDEIKQVKDIMLQLFGQWQALSERYKDVWMPGYTHQQVAMPSSFGLWFGAYAESLTDDMELLVAAYKVINKNPLGSGAGFGSAFPLNRETTTSLLNFPVMNYNSLYAQMARGRGEKALSFACSGIAGTISRFCADVCLYMGQDFGFIHFPDHLTTGSSIMPHKKNPDVFELMRARCNRVQSVPNELSLLMNNLQAGYHRDMQLTKEILFPAIDTLKECMMMLLHILPEISVTDGLLGQDKYRYIFTVEKIDRLVVGGMPFREAYKIVGDEVNNGDFYFNEPILHTHEGSVGNLCNEAVRNVMMSIAAAIDCMASL